MPAAGDNPRAPISQAALDDLKSRNPCIEVARRYVALRKSGSKMVGPCPICSTDRQSRKASRFEAAVDGWVCANCSDGGDVIKLVQRVEGLGFTAAVAHLGGAHEPDPAVAAAHAKAASLKKLKQESDAKYFRERERDALYDVWRHAVPAPGTPVEAYLALRRLALPPGVRLRYIERLDYYHGQELGSGGKKLPRIVHAGPAMVAPIVAPDGKFRGLHYTWLDLAAPNGKALIKDPDTGEQLPAKKVRGSKVGGHIELARITDPHTLFVGEGIETVLAVWQALTRLGRTLPGWGFWSAVDLGNLAGRSAETVKHPTALDAGGRGRKLPGPVPDLASDAIALPASAGMVVLLGDADSDAFATDCAMARACARHAEQGRELDPMRQVRVAWPPASLDFNDMLTGAPT